MDAMTILAVGCAVLTIIVAGFVSYSTYRMDGIGSGIFMAASSLLIGALVSVLVVALATVVHETFFVQHHYYDLDVAAWECTNSHRVTSTILVPNRVGNITVMQPIVQTHTVCDQYSRRNG
jgi:hypothetical protein